MGAERRVQQFEQWSREHGRSARESDRRRIAVELYELSGEDPVAERHVEQLVKKYRDGLMGANSILHARAVAEDLIAWQEESGQGAGDHDEEDASRARSEHPPARHAMRPGASESAAPRARSEAPPGRYASSIPPSRSERPPKWTDGALGRHDSTPLSRSDIPPRGESISSIPPRRSEAPSVGARPSTRAPASRALSERPAARGIASLDSLPPAAPAADDLFDDLDGLGSSDRPPSSRPPARASARPDPRESDRPGRSSPLPRSLSSRPKHATGDDFGDVVDRAPKKFKQGFDRPPSVRPSADGPEVERSEEGVDKERGARRSDVLTESVAPPPASIRPNVPIYAEEAAPPMSRRVLVWGGIALPILGILGFVFTRPGCSPLSNTKKSVSGPFRSKHLGVELTFSEQWLQDESKDDDEDKNGWHRRVSVFYRGTSSTDFLSQFVLVVFSRSDQRATTTDANQLGANETMGLALNRSCEPFKVPAGEDGTMCSAFTARGGQRFALVEAYFPLDGRAVFARFLLEVPMVAPAPPDSGSTSEDPTEEVLRRKVGDAQTVLSSIRSLR